MISLPVSKFNFSKRRALFLSAQKAAVYHWQNGVLGTSYLFDVNREGRDNFERYLRESPNTVMYILVDFFEEEYRRDTIPHVFGPDREAILQRKKARLFRNSHYQHTRVQGREETGRRDDRIFLSAITNPDLIDPWMEILDKYKVPMAGIHSLPLFTETIIEDLPASSNYMLIVSMQSISGLRQTFFHNREFRISRLVQMPRYGTTPYEPYLEEEVEKIQRYLSSLRLVSPDEPLDIYFLLAGGLLEDLKTHYQNSPLINYHFLDINELSARGGLALNLNTPFSDQYFAFRFLKKKQPNCYATKENLRYSTMRKMKLGMLAASILLIISGFIWSGIYFLDGLTLKRNSLAAENSRNFYQTRYDIARGRLPKTPVDPVDLEVAVHLSDTLNKYKTSPLQTINVISRGFNRFPQVKLDSLNWSSSMDPNMKVGNSPQKTSNPGAAGFSNPSANDSGYIFYHIALINGHIDPFDGNYRVAISTINEFAEYMRQSESVYDVSIISLPLDVSSTANLQGNTQAVQKEAKFVVRVVVGIPDGS